MKTAISVTLIVCGVVLVAVPPLSDAWLSLLVTRLMEHGLNHVSLEGRMQDLYRFGCWLAGVAMIVTGTVPNFRRGPVAAATRPMTVAPVAG